MKTRLPRSCLVSRLVISVLVMGLMVVLIGTLESGEFAEAQSTTIVINEVYYDPIPSQGTDQKAEWFELYNTTASDMTLTNWTISDNNSTDTIPTVIIAAHGFLVVAADEETFGNNYSSFSGAVVYVPGYIGDGLANTADALILKDDGATIIDQMNWGTPKDTWSNYNADMWDPGATDVAEGHSLERSSAGYDTDQASDFVDRTTPTPTGTPTAVTLSSFTATAYDGYVLVEWETASEIDTLGFNLYRSQSTDGLRIRLNEALILSQAVGSVGGASYQHMDSEVTGGVTYYYWLEDVEVGGASTVHGPVSAAAQRVYRIYLPIVLRNGPVGQRD